MRPDDGERQKQSKKKGRREKRRRGEDDRCGRQPVAFVGARLFFFDKQKTASVERANRKGRRRRRRIRHFLINSFGARINTVTASTGSTPQHERKANGTHNNDEDDDKKNDVDPETFHVTSAPSPTFHFHCGAASLKNKKRTKRKQRRPQPDRPRSVPRRGNKSRSAIFFQTKNLLGFAATLRRRSNSPFRQRWTANQMTTTRPFFIVL